MKITLDAVLELIGIIAFAFSGAAAAIEKRLDVFGVLVLAFATAIGGGTIRDMMIGSLPVAWLNDMETIYTILACYVISLFFIKQVRKLSHTMFWFDTFGLAFFCIVAINKGVVFNLHPLICIAIGTISGCFGGIIRDVLLNEIPYVFRKDVYASACIAGGILYFILTMFIDDANLVSLLSGALIILIRVGARYLSWQMPDITKYTNKD
jgi:uncharacterized membrane protein YeiH